MSNKSGTSSQIISLPKGGGALTGIGEKFSPDLFTGTGNFTVPIALPPGRNGFQPQLNLVYSTGSGNGPFGLGWSLSIPGVSRKTSHGVPRYDDDSDIFILSGAEDLVPIDGHHPGRVRYCPRTEGLFARIEHVRDATNDHWEVRSKDGLISVYGTPGKLGRDDPAAIAKDGDRKFAWKLTETRDPFGNRIVYTYAADEGVDGPHAWKQPLLQSIQYADYPDGADTRFLISVAFEYADRPDPFSDYRAGFEIRTMRRCSGIVVRTHADHKVPVTVREYRLEYADDPLNGVSLLKRVTVAGFDEADNTEELPPLEFGYTSFQPEGRKFFAVEGRDVPARSLANPDLELADLFGNGLPDILEMNGTVRYWRNHGCGRFDLPREMPFALAGLRLADPGVQLIDADGYGQIDLLVTANGVAGYYPLRYGGLWDRRSFQRYAAAPSFNLEDPEVKLLDLTGDGVTDAIRCGTRLECFFNDPHEGWKDTRWVERQALDEFPNVDFADPRVKWGDMSGDGLQDMVLVYDGAVEYWPNLGYGDWGPRMSMRTCPRFPYGYDPKRILVGDVDGDGLADMVYVEDTKVTLWINRSGNAWSDPIEIRGTPPVSDMDAVRLVDLLGSGISGVLWSADANGYAAPMYFLDYTGGVKPYLLTAMDNHMGATTQVAYAPSTRFYLADEARLETRWRTPLPFPVQVVARVEVVDAISQGKLTTEYRYHHGYWDGGEREFRGFGMVEQLDTETFDDYHQHSLPGAGVPFAGVQQEQFSPPTLAKTWFHQGPVGDELGDWQEMDYSSEYWPGDPSLLGHVEKVDGFLKPFGERRVKRDALRALRGRILRTELYGLDGTNRAGRPYTVTEHQYGLREECLPGDEAERLHIFFPHARAQRTTQWERGDDPLTQFVFTDDYDGYGQPRTQVQIACPRGWRTLEDKPAAPYLATRGETVYAQRDDAEVYIVDRVTMARTYELAGSGGLALLDVRRIPGSLIGETLSYYDGASFAGLPYAIDYTALDDWDYRHQVIQQIDTKVSGDRPFSFRHQFADAWYDLNNPPKNGDSVTVHFRTRRADFPPNLERLQIDQVLLYFARASGADFEVEATLKFRPEGGLADLGGVATSVDGVISTRRGNAGSWTLLVGKSVAGDWTLTLPADVKERFENEKIEDILFVITFGGRTPEWPA